MLVESFQSVRVPTPIAPSKFQHASLWVSADFSGRSRGRTPLWSESIVGYKILLPRQCFKTSIDGLQETLYYWEQSTKIGTQRIHCGIQTHLHLRTRLTIFHTTTVQSRSHRRFQYPSLHVCYKLKHNEPMQCNGYLVYQGL